MTKRSLLFSGLFLIAFTLMPSSVLAQRCAAGEELDGALCYPTCRSGYYGVGPVCWERCKSGYADHGLTCYKGIFDFYGKSSYGRGAGTVPDYGQSCPSLTMRCPTGEAFSRGRSWNAGALRCDAARPIETTLREKCGVPGGVTWNFLNNWWYVRARQANACSGPIGEFMSNWGSSYQFLQEACVIHDMCYRSHKSKQACDDEFLYNMQALCGNVGASDTALWGLCQNVGTVARIAMEHPEAQRAYDSNQSIVRDHGRQ